MLFDKFFKKIKTKKQISGYVKEMKKNESFRTLTPLYWTMTKDVRDSMDIGNVITSVAMDELNRHDLEEDVAAKYYPYNTK
jgi:hypothetical protein